MGITIFLILVAVLFIWLLKQNGNKKIKKLVGAFLVVLGLFILNPLPSLDDIFLFPLFSSFLGWDLSLESIKNNFLPYTFITGLIGLGIAWTGIYISGLKLKDLGHKIKKIFK